LGAWRPFSERSGAGSISASFALHFLSLQETNDYWSAVMLDCMCRRFGCSCNSDGLHFASGRALVDLRTHGQVKWTRPSVGFRRTERRECFSRPCNPFLFIVTLFSRTDRRRVSSLDPSFFSISARASHGPNTLVSPACAPSPRLALASPSSMPGPCLKYQ
jgi:hypothetical protein